MTKPLKTQNEWIILTLIGAVAGFCLVSLDVVVCTLSLHAEGPLCKSWEVVHIDLELGRDSTFCGAY